MHTENNDSGNAPLRVVENDGQRWAIPNVWKWGVYMGIRLYIRNMSYINEDEDEICLGKLYAYAAGNEKFESVRYMMENHCFRHDYLKYFNEYHDHYDRLEEHVECIADAEYLDYGEFAMFCGVEIFEFILHFANDWNAFWKTEHPNCNYDIKSVWAMVEEQQKRYQNTIWELRQGG